MKKQFKLSSQGLRNFTEAGVPLVIMMATSLGVSNEELFERIKNGEIHICIREKSLLKKIISFLCLK